MRLLLMVSLALAIVVSLATFSAAEPDTPKAAAARMKLKMKVTCEYKDTLLKDIVDDLKSQVEGLFLKLDTAGGVSMNRKITYMCKDKPLEEAFDEMFKKEGFGYYVISKDKNAYDGSIMIKQGNERGYAEGQGPDKGDGKKPAATKPEPKPKPEPKEAVKAEEPKPEEPKAEPAEKPAAKPKAKPDEEPKAEPEPKDMPEEKKAEPRIGLKAEPKKPDAGAEQAEAEAQRKFKLAKELLDVGKTERAKERLQEIVRKYSATKSAEDAQLLLKKLNK